MTESGKAGTDRAANYRLLDAEAVSLAVSVTPLRKHLGTLPSVLPVSPGYQPRPHLSKSSCECALSNAVSRSNVPEARQIHSQVLP